MNLIKTNNKKVFLSIIIVVFIILIASVIFFISKLNISDKENIHSNKNVNNNKETTINTDKETTTTLPDKETDETAVNTKEYYKNIIENYTIKDCNSTIDKSLFLTTITDLEEVQGNIEDSLKNKELSESDYNDLNTMINDLIDLYNKRIEEIENATTTTTPTTSTEPITKPVIQPTTTEKEEPTTKEEETTTSIVNQGDRTDESQNPYIERKDDPSNIVYNDDGTANLKETTFCFESDVEDQDAWSWDFWTFMEAIPEIREVLNQNPSYTVSYVSITKYQDTRYHHWDIRDYYLSVREVYYDTELSRNRTKLVKMWHVNDDFELVEGPIQEDIDAGKVFR